MIGHYHISKKEEIIFLSDPAKFVHEKISRVGRPEKRQSPVATEGEKVELTAAIVTFQSLRHNSPKSPPSKAEGGAP